MFEDLILELSKVLEPYRDLVGQAATWFTIAQMLSPIFVFNNMRKTKSTMGIPIIMFLLMPVFTIFSIRFAQILKDDTSFTANAVGVALSIVYFTLYYHYMSPSQKSSELPKIVYTGSFIIAVLIYSKFEDPEKIEHRFGLILTGIFYIFTVVPVLDTIRAFREKSVSHLPFAMIITGTLVGISWLLHGIIINSGFIILQNIVMLSVNFVQLWCFVIYPSETKEKGTKSE